MWLRLDKVMKLLAPLKISGLAKAVIGFTPSMAAMMVGIVIGISRVDGPFDIAFAISIGWGIPAFATIVYIFYKNAPRDSPAYVTWPAFASTTLALLIPIMSALLWLAFTMGSIDAKLDNLKP